MFERFTGEARATVVVAQDSARFLGHRHIGTEHVLLGLLRGTDSVAGSVLAASGITRERVVADIERIEQAGQESDRERAEKDAAALRTIGIDLDAVRAAVEDSFGPGALDGGTPHSEAIQGPWWRRRHAQEQARPCPPRGHIPFTPRAKKVLELSLREALALKHGYIGTEHILLGLVRENQGLGARILRDEGVQLEQLRERVLAELQRAG
ncbi:Clp domain protein [Catenulispora acidiphila DSM 44928]|uniref:Clp domain protein n=1 Tax=Catenulispora acidiphila (strain DSM 44928 / JCM 14897 / NBRC 102108 / NRRL B-24433 / ID139908) TaxID=479433 RepID=C7Q725_CATAD|nr:Clp protease N-terminal domain-containing protein [Catenulispora acidiphila]ACU76038.1 Clp domain protein [Catenulispora acidiphila DSM 44928]